jgi:hypothetical protein
MILDAILDIAFSTHASDFACWRIAVEVQYIVQTLEGGLDDEVVPDILRESQFHPNEYIHQPLKL